MPPKLVPYLTYISNLAPLNQTIDFNRAKWTAKPILKVAMDELTLAYPQPLQQDQITRTVVMDAGDRANDGTMDWNTFFLAVMLFGFGKAGYGPWRTDAMMNTPNFNAVFKNIRDQLQNGSIRGAYDAANQKINRCGPPFFTKLFYFLGWTFPTRPMPLILDARVAKSLIKCNCSSFQASQYFSASKNEMSFRWSRDGYVNYCDDLDVWAMKFNCHPSDKIEMFLFDPPNGF